MAAKSNSFSPKEFLSRLGKDDLETPLTLTGMAKSSEESSSEVLFVIGTRCGNWTSLPVDLIESVDVLGTVPCEDHLHQRVTLTFKAPKSPEAAAYAALLSAALKQQGPGMRVVRKKGGAPSGKAPSQNGAATFMAGGCGCSDYEIDLAGRVYELYSVTEFDDGCICDYR